MLAIVQKTVTSLHVNDAKFDVATLAPRSHRPAGFVWGLGPEGLTM